MSSKKSVAGLTDVGEEEACRVCKKKGTVLTCLRAPGRSGTSVSGAEFLQGGGSWFPKAVTYLPSWGAVLRK